MCTAGAKAWAALYGQREQRSALLQCIVTESFFNVQPGCALVCKLVGQGWLARALSTDRCPRVPLEGAHASAYIWSCGGTLAVHACGLLRALEPSAAAAAATDLLRSPLLWAQAPFPPSPPT